MNEIFISLILLFLGIAALVLIHVFVVGRALRRRNHQGGNEEQSNGDFDGIGTKRMSSEEMKDLPCFEYKEAEKEEGGGSSSTVTGDCAVCLESFKDGDMCRFLPNCSHSFHVTCIDSWILKTPICPICRTWVNSPMIPTVVTEQVDASQHGVIEIV